MVIIVGCSPAIRTMEQNVDENVLCETDFQVLDNRIWRIGYAHKYGIKPGGLWLFANYFKTAIVWYRNPVPENIDVTMKVQYIIGGHPILIILSGLGTGGATNTGYSIEIGKDANTHGVLKRLDEIVADSPFGVFALGDIHLIQVTKRSGLIKCYLDRKLIFSYTDNNPLSGEAHEFLGFGLGKSYSTPHTHVNSEEIIHYVKISKPK